MQQEEGASRADVFQAVTDVIVRQIEAGAGTYKMPWHHDGSRSGRPVNAATGSAYRGINTLALWAAAAAHAYPTGHWATYRQWRELDAQVRKGEQGTTVVFWKPVVDERPLEEKLSDDRPRRRVIARGYTVFNGAQVDGWEPVQLEATDITWSTAELDWFINGVGADIRHGGDRAFYAPDLDCIVMPNRAQFFETAAGSAQSAYHATLFHELTHWTGHSSRLDRDLHGRFGSADYAMEELVAELGAAFLCADLGVSNTPRTDHAAYVASWLNVLRGDRRAFLAATTHAVEAVRILRSQASLPETEGIN